MMISFLLLLVLRALMHPFKNNIPAIVLEAIEAVIALLILLKIVPETRDLVDVVDIQALTDMEMDNAMEVREEATETDMTVEITDMVDTEADTTETMMMTEKREDL